MDSRLRGLRSSSPLGRRSLVAEALGLDGEALIALDPESGLSLAQADHMVENVVGVIGVPVGVATNFVVNGVDRIIPMATEEPSVVAAASNAARMARPHGGFSTSSTGNLMIAQIQIVEVEDPVAAQYRVLESQAELLELANTVDPVLVGLGGGAQRLEVQCLRTRTGTHVIVHLIVDVLDAMGANAVNSMAEALAPRLADLAVGRSLLRILSNKADLRLTRVRAVFDADMLGGPEVVSDIVHASAFAEADPYRAATHNKGIMNGITAVVLATGNDTRAVESGCHSHAARDGSYTALSRFEKTADGNLAGTLEVPMPVGLVGGATKVHPVAQAMVKVLEVRRASELADVIASVGLAQNLAALRALSAEGIQRGHMKLHARTIAASAGALPQEVASIAEQMVAAGKIRADYAAELLRGRSAPGSH